MKLFRKWFLANLMKISLFMIIAGFFIMALDTTDANGGESFHQLTVAPVVLIIGYSLIIFAIMKPGRDM